MGGDHDGDRRGGSRTAELLECFPRTIEVPPPRHHIENVPELVRHFLGRLTHSGEQVLLKVVLRRRSRVVEVADGPTEISATVRRALTAIGAIECDAIVNALLETGGNKASAAGECSAMTRCSQQSRTY